MGLLADDVRFDRRSALKALLILLAVLAVGFAVAWLTIGRAARFQSMKGVFLSFELPAAFTEIDEEGSGGSITSLTRPPEIERTYSAGVPAPRACRVLERAFKRGDVAVLPLSLSDPGVECNFSGPVGGYSVEADIRTTEAFVELVRREELDVPKLPPDTRSVASIRVRS